MPLSLNVAINQPPHLTPVELPNWFHSIPFMQLFLLAIFFLFLQWHLSSLNKLYLCENKECGLVSRRYQLDLNKNYCPHCSHIEGYTTKYRPVEINRKNPYVKIEVFFALKLRYKDLWRYYFKKVKFLANQQEKQELLKELQLLELKDIQLNRYNWRLIKQLENQHEAQQETTVVCQNERGKVRNEI